MMWLYHVQITHTEIQKHHRCPLPPRACLTCDPAATPSSNKAAYPRGGNYTRIVPPNGLSTQTANHPEDRSAMSAHPGSDTEGQHCRLDIRSTVKVSRKSQLNLGPQSRRVDGSVGVVDGIKKWKERTEWSNRLFCGGKG